MLNQEERLKEWDRVKIMCKGTKFEGREYECVKVRFKESRFFTYSKCYQPYFRLHKDRIFAVAIVDDTPIWLEEPFTLYQKEDLRFIDMKFTYRSHDRKLIGSGRARSTVGGSLGNMKVSIPIDKVVWKNFTLTKPSTLSEVGKAEDFVDKLYFHFNDIFADEQLKKLKDTPVDSKQVGGSHYKDKATQPWAYMEANFTKEEFVGFLRGNAHKYLDRYKDKNGIEDLKEAIHYIEKLVEVEGT